MDCVASGIVRSVVEGTSGGSFGGSALYNEGDTNLYPPMLIR